MTCSEQQRSDVMTDDSIFVVSERCRVVEIIGFYTSQLFQTMDRRKAESKMGKEEANQDLTWKRKI